MSKASEIEILERKLEEKGFDPELLEVLNEFELFRLLENFESKNSIVQATVALDLESFDNDLPDIFQETKSFSEVITTLPDQDGDPDKISFKLIYAGDKEDVAKLKEFFTGKKYFKGIKNLPESGP